MKINNIEEISQMGKLETDRVGGKYTIDKYYNHINL